MSICSTIPEKGGRAVNLFEFEFADLLTIDNRLKTASWMRELLITSGLRTPSLKTAEVEGFEYTIPRQLNSSDSPTPPNPPPP